MGIYRNIAGDPDLNLHQIAGITNDTEHGVRVRLATTLTKMRREALHQHIKEVDVNRFEYFQGARVCAHCGALITRQSLNPQLTYRGFQWCSRECKVLKPEWVIAAEQKYGTDILTILYHALKMFNKILPISLILHARRKVLIAYYAEHFHISPADFGVEAMDAVDILRNTMPLNTWGFGTSAGDKIQHPKLRKVLDKLEYLVKYL